jgi:drug/metabolite transporter (DMT)-like permease
LRFAVASALPGRADLPGLLAAGFLGIFAYPVALGYGQKRVGSGPATVLVESAPVFTAMLAALFPCRGC